jgi:4'-phosphopantetheinyl transferase
MALIAVSAGHRLGADIEKESADVDVIALAERCFSTREYAALRALPDRLRQAAFFACWTRKESFLKAIGEGLSFPLADFSVTINPDLAPALEEIRGDREAGKQWFLADLSVVDGYRAAVAVESSFSRLETYTA